MTFYSGLVFFLILLNLIIFLNLNKISLKINLYDYPNLERKIHNKPTPLIGGIIIFINFFIITLSNFFFSFLNEGLNQIFVFSFLIFIIALIDDKISISAGLKFLLLSFIILIFFFLNQDFLLSYVPFEFKNLIISNKLLSFFVSWLSVMLFMNAINLFDGVNGQLSIYLFIIFLFFILNNVFFYFSILMLISIVFFIIFNFNGKIFLGDNGSLFLGFLISMIFIYNNNFLFSKISAEKIFLIMFLPGIDMFRLFIMRILKKKSPFQADNNHLHHILFKRFNQFTRLFITNFLITIPLLASYFFNTYLVILVSVIFYFVLLFNLNKIKVQ